MSNNWSCNCVGPQSNGKCPCEQDQKLCECPDAPPGKLCECKKEDLTSEKTCDKVLEQ
jgi:hypothetical protein